jgi:hypothetical protein
VPKGRPSASSPQITLIQFEAMLLQQPQEFLLAHSIQPSLRDFVNFGVIPGVKTPGYYHHYQIIKIKPS